jgi:hypothetical protein
MAQLEGEVFGPIKAQIAVTVKEKMEVLFAAGQA